MMNRIATTIGFNMRRPICRDVLEESIFNDATNFGEGQVWEATLADGWEQLIVQRPRKTAQQAGAADGTSPPT